MKATNSVKLMIPVLAAMVLSSLPAAAQNGNSYSHMLSITSAMNTNLWNAQNRVQESTNRAAQIVSESQGARAQGGGAPQQFTAPRVSAPIFATDFQGFAGRILPDQLVASMTGATPQQKEQMRIVYYKLLAAFEGMGRRNNVAAAAAWAMTACMEVERGGSVPERQHQQMTRFYNDLLAATPAFQAMNAQQKQVLYESLVLSAGTAVLLKLQGEQERNPLYQEQARQLARTMLQQWPSMM